MKTKTFYAVTGESSARRLLAFTSARECMVAVRMIRALDGKQQDHLTYRTTRRGAEHLCAINRFLKRLHQWKENIYPANLGSTELPILPRNDNDE